jgi:hypothetical protein
MAQPRIRITLGSHVRFGNIDFICTGVDYDLVLLPPDVNVDAISKALSSLRLVTDEGQVLESDHPGGSQSGTRPAGTPQADATLGGPIRHCRSSLTQHIQAGYCKRQSLHQRLKHRTATSLLPLDFQVVYMLNLTKNKKGARYFFLCPTLSETQPFLWLGSSLP